VKDILNKLEIGNSVAEFDGSLKEYFFETQAFSDFVQGKCDIVAGDKGTGKTALFKIVYERRATLPELRDVEVVPAFNSVGAPVFQRLIEGGAYNEGQYQTLWKSYFASLAGSHILDSWDGRLTDSMMELDEMLCGLGLRVKVSEPGHVFSSLLNLWRRITNPAAIESSVTITAQGMPVIKNRTEFDKPEIVGEMECAYIPHEAVFELLQKVLDEVDTTVWLVIDRLDEAFAGLPKAEIPALRALFRSYLDLAAYPRISLKLFIRRDLFRRVITGGFVNLTHINAKRMEISWDESDLRHMLMLRVSKNPDFLAALGLDPRNKEAMYTALFPDQIDVGEKKPKTWSWMMSRIRDGNDVRPPRHLIDLVNRAKVASIRSAERDQTEHQGGALLGPESFKKALTELSKARVEDTLLAEAGNMSAYIERFRDGKAEHNETSLGRTLKQRGDELHSTIKFLTDIGFLEQVGSSYKIPMLYRDGLSITQGKAF
jgi:hypothetical protein